MIDRARIKADAKAAMRPASPRIYLISLLFLVLTHAESVVVNMPLFQRLSSAETADEILSVMQAWTTRSGSGLVTLISLLLTLFLVLVQVGYDRYTLQISRGNTEGGAEVLFQCFNRFWQFVALYLITYIFTVLWSMLLVIPGIIAALSYSQAYYILLDNPDISAMEALRRSKELMRGHKWEYFVLILSFIGWMILSGMTFGILLIWLQPYLSVTFGNYYNALVEWTPAQAAGFDPEPPPAKDEWWNN